MTGHRRKGETSPHQVLTRNVVSLYFSSTEASEPQGKPLEMQVKEDGQSESRLVMKRIRVEPAGDMTLRESEQTSVWSFRTRELEKPPKRESR